MSTPKSCSVCGEFPESRGVHRRLEVVIVISADDETELRDRAQQILGRIQQHGKDSGRFVSGAPGSGAWIKVTEDPDQTHERWEADLEEYLERREIEARAGDPVSPEVNR